LKPLDSTYNTILVPSLIRGLEEVFLNQYKWPNVRLRADRIPFIQYISIYVSAPTSAITHFAKVKRIDRENDTYTLYFEKPIELKPHIPFIKGQNGIVPQSLRLIKFEDLKANSVNEIFGTRKVRL
jgi:hypothetical protein